jgi:hypothetical protein
MEASRRFTPRERTPDTHWIGDCVGTRPRSGHGGEEKNSQPLPGFEPPIIQPATPRYTTELSGSWNNWANLSKCVTYQQVLLII